MCRQYDLDCTCSHIEQVTLECEARRNFRRLYPQHPYFAPPGRPDLDALDRRCTEEHQTLEEDFDRFCQECAWDFLEKNVCNRGEVRRYMRHVGQDRTIAVKLAYIATQGRWEGQDRMDRLIEQIINTRVRNLDGEWDYSVPQGARGVFSERDDIEIFLDENSREYQEVLALHGEDRIRLRKEFLVTSWQKQEDSE